MDDEKINIEKLNRTNIYKVPDGYFDDLTIRIQSQIQNQEDSKIVPIYYNKSLWLSSAAMVIILIGIFIFPIKQYSLNADQILSEVKSEDLINYLEQENLSMDEILASVDTDYLINEISIDEDAWLQDEISEEALELMYSEMGDIVDFM